MHSGQGVGRQPSLDRQVLQIALDRPLHPYSALLTSSGRIPS